MLGYDGHKDFLRPKNKVKTFGKYGRTVIPKLSTNVLKRN